MKTMTEMNSRVPGKIWSAMVIEGIVVALCLGPAGWVAILTGVAVVAAGTVGALAGGWVLKNRAEWMYDTAVEKVAQLRASIERGA